MKTNDQEIIDIIVMKNDEGRLTSRCVVGGISESSDGLIRIANSIITRAEYDRRIEAGELLVIGMSVSLGE